VVYAGIMFSVRALYLRARKTTGRPATTKWLWAISGALSALGAVGSLAGA
jgi:hypothetical protein